jgi:hypothetical protein
MGFTGLQVIDVSNPANPQRSGQLCHQRLSIGRGRLGNYAYVADGYSGLQVIDVSNPANPQRVGGYDTIGDATRCGRLGQLRLRGGWKCRLAGY